MASLTTLGARWSVLHRPSEGTDTGDTERESQANTVPPVMYNMYNTCIMTCIYTCICIRCSLFSVPCLYMRRRAMACQSRPSLRSDLSQPEWTNQAQSVDLLNR